MALGLSFGGEGGDGEIIPIIKYDARSGRIFRRDGKDANQNFDITREFKAVFDFENIEVGYIDFDTGGAPSFHVAHYTQPRPANPGGKHREGIRMLVKLGQECAGGAASIRELASVAGAFKRGLDALHDAYMAGMQANPGKLPVVVLKGSTPITTGSGDKKSTNYVPDFEIVNWVARPKDLEAKPRAAPAGASQGGQTQAPAQGGTPPATGGTRAAPPQQATQQAPAAAEEDFG